MQWRIIVQLKCQMFNVNCIMLLFYIVYFNKLIFKFFTSYDIY